MLINEMSVEEGAYGRCPEENRQETPENLMDDLNKFLSLQFISNVQLKFKVCSCFIFLSWKFKPNFFPGF